MARDKSVLEPLVRSIESTKILDEPAKWVSSAVRSALSPGAVKDALSGTWLGHALHPALTDVVMTCFMGATAADLVAGKAANRVSERMIMLGMGAYVPTAAAGASDWIDGASDERVKRV